MKNPVSEKIRQNAPCLLEITVTLVIVIALIVTAGCLFPDAEHPPSSPSPCSPDAGACPGVIPRSVRIDAAPQIYTPLMSSTPGIGLTPNVTGFTPSDAEYTWNASYGEFLDWTPPDYTVRSLSPPVINHGEKVYWSFTNPPASTRDPVTISVTARDRTSGQILGSSYLTLTWEGNLTVIIQKTE